VTPVDIMAAIAAVSIAASVVLVVHAIRRRRRPSRQPTHRDGSEADGETPDRTKRKV